MCWLVKEGWVGVFFPFTGSEVSTGEWNCEKTKANGSGGWDPSVEGWWDPCRPGGGGDGLKCSWSCECFENSPIIQVMARKTLGLFGFFRSLSRGQEKQNLKEHFPINESSGHLGLAVCALSSARRICPSLSAHCMQKKSFSSQKIIEFPKSSLQLSGNEGSTLCTKG